VQRIFHIIDRSEWRVAQAESHYRPESLARDGFVHFSFADQVVGTASRYYRSRDDLLVLEIDPERLDDPVVVEDRYGHGEAFPHVYGAIPSGAVVTEHPLPRTAAGDFTFDPEG